MNFISEVGNTFLKDLGCVTGSLIERRRKDGVLESALRALSTLVMTLSAYSIGKIIYLAITVEASVSISGLALRVLVFALSHDLFRYLLNIESNMGRERELDGLILKSFWQGLAK